MAKEIWSSRLAFLFAAIGAAIGFGNIWRFPALAYEYGGGAFFIPYVMALCLVGIPLLILEISMGQHKRTGDVGVFGSINHRLRGIGLSSVICGFFVTCYYVPLIAWVVRAFVESFGHMSDDWEDISGTEATQYFYHQVIGMSTLDEDDLRPTRIVWANVGYLAFVWICIGVCLGFGIKWTGRISYFTMGLPIILLAFFFVRAVTLPGASEGIHAYIGEWDLSVLKERPDCWSTAVTQIFFSLGVTFGVMTAFGSHCPQDAPARENSVIIALANSFFSFVSGFAVFGVLGYLKQYENAEHIDEVVKAGPALLFGTYPAALSTVPGGLYWVRFLFFNLFLLGIDSAFALTEAVITVLKDSVLGSVASHRVLVAGTISLGFVCGLMYTTDAGIVFLDVVDFYINFVMLLVGFIKTFAAGWLYGVKGQVESLGHEPVYAYMATTFGAVIAGSWVWFGIEGSTTGAGFLVFFLWYACGTSLCIYLLRQEISSHPEKGWTWKSIIMELAFKNAYQLRDELESSVGKLPLVWPFLIKHLIPPSLLILFFNLACAKNDEGESDFGNYAGYTNWPFQVLGISAVAVVVLVFLVGAIYPKGYEILSATQDADADDKKTVADEESDTFDDDMNYTELPEKSLPVAA